MAAFTSNLDYSNKGKNNENLEQYLIFKSGDDSYCVNANLIVQIEFYESHHPIPSAPNYVLGVVRALGRIVTLVHLGRRLKINNNPVKKGYSHIIYINRGNDRIIGMVVDHVITLEQIPMKHFKEDFNVINTQIPLDFILGTVTLEDHGIIIQLNTDLVLSNFQADDLDVKVDTKLTLDSDEIDRYDLMGAGVTPKETLEEDEKEDDEDDLFSKLDESTESKIDYDKEEEDEFL